MAIKMTGSKRYTCCRCGEVYEMDKVKYSQRSMTILKRTCTEKECEVESKVAASMKHIEKQRKDQRKAKTEKRKADLESIKSLADWKNDLQSVINWIVKKIDHDVPCISHPDMVGFLRYDAGHYFTVKAHSDVRFNFHNIHKQNSQANERYGGDGNYVIGIRDRYGGDYLDRMLNLPLKWKGIGKELWKIDNIRTVYLPNARKLKKEIQGGFIPTRDQANEMIGIYTIENLKLVS